jgi:hypothetical protein
MGLSQYMESWSSHSIKAATDNCAGRMTPDTSRRKGM